MDCIISYSCAGRDPGVFVDTVSGASLPVAGDKISIFL
jgi:hypothetical protein